MVVDGLQVEQVWKFKYLGVTLESEGKLCIAETKYVIEAIVPAPFTKTFL